MKFGGRRRPAEEREVVKPDSEWRADLSAEQFRVLRKKATETPFSGKHVHPEPGMRGMFRCAGCDAELFDSATQFDSGTGWPSFFDADAGAVERHRDFSIGIPRTEVLCRRCGGHLGHVFGDGPTPTGQRYCINDAALAPPRAADEPS